MTPLLLFMCSASPYAADTPLRPFRFIEAKAVKEGPGLPPQLEVIFDAMCNEELIQVIRHDWVDPKSKKVTIAVGALVRENPLSSCAGVKREMTAKAGSTFSGREFEISRIK